MFWSLYFVPGSCGGLTKRFFSPPSFLGLTVVDEDGFSFFLEKKDLPLRGFLVLLEDLLENMLLFEERDGFLDELLDLLDELDGLLFFNFPPPLFV